MPIPANVLKVSLLWTAPTTWPAESAVNTFHLQNQSGPSGQPPNPQYVADQVAAKLLANWTGLAPFFSSLVHINAVRTYLLDTAGHTTAEGSHSFTSVDLAGNAGGGMLPPEVSVALSEYAYAPGGFAPRKGAKRGRMYLPYIAKSACTTNGRVDPTMIGSMLSACQTLFNSINTIQSASGRTDPMGLVVLSKATAATYEVLHLAIDDHFDSQRRRQHQDAPARQSVDLTGW